MKSWTVFADRPGYLTTFAEGDILLQDEAFEDAGPHFGLMRVDHSPRQQTSTHHLEQVLVLEVFISRDDAHCGAVFFFKALVQLDQVRVVAARFTHHDVLATEVRYRCDGRRRRPGDQDLLN